MSDDDRDDPSRAQREGLRPRQLSDARTLRALTHPIRIALIELLGLEGPKTATEASERLGESPASCSFHLRQLARYGFVEEAGGGRGRARPWRMTRLGISWSTVHDDSEVEVAANALSELMRARQLDRYRAWLQTRTSYSPAWREAALHSEFLFWLTPDELQQLGRRMIDTLLPLYRERLTDPSARPDAAVPVELLMFGYPIGPPTAGD